MGRRILISFIVFYALTMSGEFFFGDGNEMTQIADTILKHSSLALESGAQAYGWRNAVVAPDGKRYSKFGIGLPLIEVPFLYLGNKLALLCVDARIIINEGQFLFVNGIFLFSVTALVSALLCFVFYNHLKLLGYSERACVSAALLMGICTVVWPISKRGHTEPLQALLFMTCWFGLKKSVASPKSEGWAALAGACLGYAILTKISAAAVVPIFFLYAGYLWTSKKDVSALAENFRQTMRDPLFYRRTSAFLFPFSVFCGFAFYYNRLRTGNLLSFGYGIPGSSDAYFGFSNPLFTGLYGLLLSPGKSIFLYSPPLILFFSGIRGFFHRHREEASLISAFAVVNLFFFAKWYVWNGDFFWGPRFMSIVVPFMMVPVAEFLESVWPQLRIGARWAVTGLCLLAFYINLIGSCFSNLDFQYATYINSPFKMIGDRALEENPLMNDAYHLNFIPDYSPILGHHWIFKHKLLKLAGVHGTEEEYREELAADVPWRKFNAKWTPAKEQLNFEWDFWFVRFYSLFFGAESRQG